MQIKGKERNGKSHQIKSQHGAWIKQQTMGIEWKTTKKRWVKKLVLLRHHGITGTLFSDKPLFFSGKLGGI